MNAIITGASKGIGYAIAEKLVCEGVNIAICARTETDLNQAVYSLKQANSNIEIYSEICDLSIKEQAIQFGQHALHHFGSIQLLINNAGTFIPGELCTEDDGVLEKLISVNLYSAYHLTRVIAPSMKSNSIDSGSRGHIMNISSVAALKAYDHGGSYSISKYALEGFSKNLREELKPFHIKVTTLNPGATMSDSWKGSGIDASRIIDAKDIASLIWTMYQLSPQTVVEDIVLRPQLGDL